MLDILLTDIEVPCAAVDCKIYDCKAHFEDIHRYHDAIIEACRVAGISAIPRSKPATQSKTGTSIPG